MRQPALLPLVVVTVLLSGTATASAWGPNDKISCAEVTADWPLWSALSKRPWTQDEIRDRHYSDDADPEGVVTANANGAFEGRGGDSGVYFDEDAQGIIAHMLAAPTDAVCGDPTGEPLRLTIDNLIHGYSPYRSRPWDDQDKTEPPLDAADPVLAALEVVNFSAFNPRNPWGWHNDGDWAKTDISEEYHNYARAHWQADHNPLWMVALLENSRDPGDLADIQVAADALHNWPGLSPAAQSHYLWRLAAQAVRLHLIKGDLDKALAAARLMNEADLQRLKDTSAHLDIAAATEVIMKDGERWLIRQEDRQSARRWALEAMRAFGIPIYQEFKPLLVSDLDELYGSSPLGLERIDGKADLGPARAIFDTFSAATLIQLSKRSGITDGDRRAMVGAAWVRAYALKRDKDVIAWLPNLREIFPELADAIQGIENAQSTAQKRHLLTHLLLTAPGLIAIPSWARPPGGPRHMSVIDHERPQSVLAFDTENPNDGNWWCDPEADETRALSVSILLEWALTNYQSVYERALPAADDMARAAEREKVLATTKAAFANYPVLSQADSTELAALSKTGSATMRLGQEAIDWSRSYNPKTQAAEGPLLAEALAQTVKATRYACHDEQEVAKVSKAAYDALHRLFPDSTWAKATRAWFRSPRSYTP